MLSRSGGLCRGASESDESEIADPGGSLTDDNDKDEGGGDFTSGF